MYPIQTVFSFILMIKFQNVNHKVVKDNIHLFELLVQSCKVSLQICFYLPPMFAQLSKRMLIGREGVNVGKL